MVNYSDIGGPLGQVYNSIAGQDWPHIETVIIIHVGVHTVKIDTETMGFC